MAQSPFRKKRHLMSGSIHHYHLNQITRYPVCSQTINYMIEANNYVLTTQLRCVTSSPWNRTFNSYQNIVLRHQHPRPFNDRQHQVYMVQLAKIRYISSDSAANHQGQCCFPSIRRIYRLANHIKYEKSTKWPPQIPRNLLSGSSQPI